MVGSVPSNCTWFYRQVGPFGVGRLLVHHGEVHMGSRGRGSSTSTGGRVLTSWVPLPLLEPVGRECTGKGCGIGTSDPRESRCRVARNSV